MHRNLWKNILYKCYGLTDYDADVVLTKPNVLFMCEECIHYKKTVFQQFERVLHEIDECKTVIKKRADDLREMLINFQKQLENKEKHDMRGKVESLKSSEKQETTYAEMLKSAPPVIVKPKIKQDCNKTKEVIKKNVDPSELKFTGIGMKKNGAVAIESSNNEEQQKIKNAVQEKFGDKYEIEVPKERKPRIIVSGIKDLEDDNEIVAAIKKQNDHMKESKIRCLRTWKGKNKKYKNAVLEVDRETYWKAMEIGKINVGWDRCSVFDGTYVKRCFKCLGFSHESTTCSKKEVCAKCLGEHGTINCTKDYVSQCINCKQNNEKLGLNIDYNHNTLSWQCPTYLNMVRKEKRKIGY